MNAKETIALAAILFAVIVIYRLARLVDAALDRTTGKLSITLEWKGLLRFVMVLTGIKPLPPKTKPPKTRNGGQPAQISQSWFRRRRRMLAGVCALAQILATPVFWWRQQPEAWKLQVVDAWNGFVNVAAHDPKTPVIAHLGEETRRQLALIFKIYTNQLRQDPYKNVDVWVLNHYWQYWNTQNFDEYLDANRLFVASGGRIHRMFFLTNKELQDPEVQKVLQYQCRIGQMTAGQTGNGFELWRADPDAIQGREEYETVARSFRQLPETGRSFEDFNIVQFQDALYYSADFTPNHRALGSSVWLFNPEHVSKIDLKPLFRKSIAERLPCDQPVLRTASAGLPARQ